MLTRFMLLALLCVPAGALASEYDYIRSDDPYHENDRYELHYEGLSSLPEDTLERHADAPELTPSPPPPGTSVNGEIQRLRNLINPSRMDRDKPSGAAPGARTGPGT
jgi:hypothetical protein